MVALTRPGLIRRWLRGAGSDNGYPQAAVQDIQVGVPPGISTRGAKAPSTKQKAVILQMEHRQFRAGFAEPEYNLLEIQQAMDTEGYLRLSFDKHEELILKNGWRLVGQNPSTVAWVNRRLTEIGWSQDSPFEAIVESGVEDLVETANVFYVLARREGGRKYRSKFGRMLAPITGIFSPNSASMRPFIKTSRRGVKEINRWHQIVGGRVIKRFKPYNVLHMGFRKKKGHIFGTPYCVPTLDDILALRRMEELVEVLVHKHAYPFFHYRVGTKDLPAREYDDGHSEVDDVRAEVAAMPFEGGLVTPFRHEIVVLGAKNKAILVEPYMKYFEARVLSGLNLSGIDIGRGETANRATAQTMSKGLADRCTRFQLFFSIQFTFQLLDELVREFGALPTPENRVYLLFPTIDTEEARAKENHALLLYQGHLISETEARVDIGRDPVKDPQRSDMYFERVDKLMALIKAVDEDSGLGSKKAVSTRDQPTNQNKRLASKPKVAANDASIRVRGLWDSSSGQMLSNLDGVALFFDRLGIQLEADVSQWLNDGLERYVEEYKPDRSIYLGNAIQQAFLSDVYGPAKDALQDYISEGLDRQKSGEHRRAAIDSLWLAVEQLVITLEPMAENYGYARAAQINKKKQVRWEVADGDDHSDPMFIRRFGYSVMRQFASLDGHLKVVEVDKTPGSRNN